MHKYKININTCFDCSHNQLINDMSNFSKLQQMSTALNINKRDRRSIEELEQEQKELKEKKAKH